MLHVMAKEMFRMAKIMKWGDYFLTWWVPCYHKGPNKRQTEGDLAQKTM